MLMWGAHTPLPLLLLEGSDPSLVHLLPEYTSNVRREQTRKSHSKCGLLSPMRECFPKTLYIDDNANSIMHYINFWLEPPGRVCCFSKIKSLRWPLSLTRCWIRSRGLSWQVQRGPQVEDQLGQERDPRKSWWGNCSETTGDVLDLFGLQQSLDSERRTALGQSAGSVI